jgi:hypothetical protein
MISCPFSLRYCLLFILIAIDAGTIWSQSDVPLILDSGVDVNLKVGGGFILNAGMRYRDIMIADLGEAPIASDSRFLQFSSNLNYQIGFYDRLGGGVMFRSNSVGKDGVSNEFRITQEYIHVKKYNALRLAHRFKLDQRTFESLSPEFRFRYRFSLDMPLNGLKLDPGEFYALISTETLLNNGTAFAPEWDQRFNLAIGNQVLENMKGQVDIQYRGEDFTARTKNRIFLIVSLIISL